MSREGCACRDQPVSIGAHFPGLFPGLDGERCFVPRCVPRTHTGCQWTPPGEIGRQEVDLPRKKASELMDSEASKNAWCRLSDSN